MGTSSVPWINAKYVKPTGPMPLANTHKVFVMIPLMVFVGGAIFIE